MVSLQEMYNKVYSKIEVPSYGGKLPRYRYGVQIWKLGFKCDLILLNELKEVKKIDNTKIIPKNL